MNTADTQLVSPSDVDWGYRFGIDGVMSMGTACELLDVSRETVRRRAGEGRLRMGHDGGRVKICRRSLLDYIKQLED